MSKNKDVVKKAAALSALVGVVGGVSVGINSYEEAHATNKSPKQSIKHNDNESTPKSKRPKSNGNTDIDKSSNEEKSRSGTRKTTRSRGDGNAKERRGKVKIISSDNSNEESGNQKPTQRPDAPNGYRSVEEKKKMSKDFIEKNRTTPENNKSDRDKIIITVSTK